MDAKTKVARARTHLVMNNPMMGFLALNIPIRESTACPTFATDGRSVMYNPSYVDGLSEAETVAVLCEEYMHVALAHASRRAGRDPELWNKAIDQVVWEILSKSKYAAPVDSFYRPQWDGMSADAVYAELAGERADQGGGGDDREKQGFAGEGGGSPTSAGEVVDLPDGESPQRYEMEQKLLLQNALNTARMAGKVPAGLELLVEEILRPKIPWREVLARWIHMRAREDYSWSRPHKAYLQRGIHMPSLRSESLADVVLVRDTSGSTVNLKEIVTSEVVGILEAFPWVSLTVLDADYEVAAVYEQVSLENIRDLMRPRGGGGTSYAPALEWVRRNRQEAVGMVYVTDGECEDFGSDPGIDVLWVLTGRPWTQWKPPFGETVVMEE
jgi:predicted metal-dependent peptidase